MLKEALSVAELVIIKRDSDILAKLGKTIEPALAFNIIPYISLFGCEILRYLQEKGQQTDMDWNSSYSISDMRNKAKIFNVKTSKILMIIENIDHLQNDTYIKLMKYPKLGHWNVHSNLGIYFDDENHIVGNTHYSYYVSMDEKLIQKKRDDLSLLEPEQLNIDPNELKMYSYDLGRIIGSMSEALSTVSDFFRGNVSEGKILVCHKDYNTNRMKQTIMHHGITK